MDSFSSSCEEKMCSDSEFDREATYNVASVDEEDEVAFQKQIIDLLSKKLYYQSRRAAIEYFHDGIRPDPSGIRATFKEALTHDELWRQQREICREQKTLNDVERNSYDEKKLREANALKKKIKVLEGYEKKFNAIFDRYGTDAMRVQEDLKSQKLRGKDLQKLIDDVKEEVERTKKEIENRARDKADMA